MWIVPSALILFVVGSDLLGWRYLRQPAADFLSSRLERRVELGKPFRLHLRPRVALQIGSVLIAAPPWSAEPHFAELKDLKVEMDWKVLLGREPVVHLLAVEKADVRAERNPDGLASWTMGPGQSGGTDGGGTDGGGTEGRGTAAGEPQVGEAKEGASPLPRVLQLSVGQATIMLKDAPQALSLQLTARTEAPPAQAAEGGQRWRLSANGGGTWNDQPVSLELHAAASLPLPEGAFGADLDLKGKLKSAEVTFNGSVTDLIRLQGLSGTVSASGDSLGELSSIPGLALPSTPPYRLQGKVSRKGSATHLEVGTADVGSSSLKARLDYEPTGTIPVLRGTVDASRLVLRDLAPSIGADTEESREFNLKLLRAMNADVGIDLNKLDLGTEILKPLHGVKARLLLEGGILRMENIAGDLAGGGLTGSIVLDASATHETPAFEASLRWQGVDLKNWLNVGAGGYLVAGRFKGETRLKSRGNSTAAIVRALDGTVKGRIDGGSVSHQMVELAGLDVAEALGVTLSGDKPLALNCALVDFTAQQGTLRSDLFLLNTSDTLFFVQGTLGLASRRLNLRLVQSPNDWSPLSLRSPVTISGTFKDPVLGIDPAPAAVKMLSSVVMAAVTPIAALLPLVDIGDAPAKSGCGPAIERVKAKAAELGPVPASPAVGVKLKGSASKGAASKGAASKDAASKEAGSKQAATKEVASKRAAPREASRQTDEKRRVEERARAPGERP